MRTDDSVPAQGSRDTGSGESRRPAESGSDGTAARLATGPTRRRLLRVATTAAVGGVGGLAGCTGAGDTGTDEGGSDADGQDGESDQDSEAGESGDRETPTGEPTATPTEAPDPIEAWPTFQHDAARTGYVASGTAPTAGVTEQWSAGQEIDAGAVESSPAVADGTVYVGGPDKKLHALNATDGTEQWTVESRNRFGSPTVVDGTVYAVDRNTGGGPFGLYAVNAADGTERWTLELSGGLFRGTTPAVVGGTVFLARQVGSTGMTGILTAVNAADGTEQWTVEGSGVAAGGSLTVADGTVYVPSQAQGVTAYDGADGTEQWSFSPGEEALLVPAPVPVFDGTVYVGTENGLTSVDAADGSTQWSVTLSTEGEHSGTTRPTYSPAVSDQAVYVPTRQGVFALSRDDGSQRWLSGPPVQDSAPVVVGETVYVGGDDGSVYALNTADGSTRWSFEIGRNAADEGVRSTPAVAGGTVYVGGPDARLYALTVEGTTSEA